MKIHGCFMSKHSRWMIFSDTDGVLKADRQPRTSEDAVDAWVSYSGEALDITDFTVEDDNGRRCLTRVAFADGEALLTTAWEVYP